MTIAIDPEIDAAAGPTLPPLARTSPFEGRSGVTRWSATCLDRDNVFAVLTSPPFVLANPGSQSSGAAGPRGTR